ncbi:MAG TPA: dihydrolipoamide acetyltransferase family protein [Thermodesulfobacteriota bacterium]|nr:dihydrolipoamide acetyltransferase family protein [Thermodesulfobacteriota bacterium]
MTRRGASMLYEFKLPDLGEGITEGEVVKWRVKDNDEVTEHQVVVEVETDKAIVEVPSPKKGKVVKLSAAEGETVKTGQTLLVIDIEGEAADEGAKKSFSVVGSLPMEEEVLATPMVRNLAKKLGIDLLDIKGTGPGGRTTEEDVRSAAQSVKKETTDRHGSIERVPIKGVRKAIAKNLLLSQKNSAFVTGMDDADITELWNLKAREKTGADKKGVHLTLMPFFVKAAVHALMKHPYLNSSVDEETEEIVIKRYYNIGVAVDTPDGLMVPVVKDADKKTIIALASEIHELGLKARERKLSIEELKGSTFTITNYGTIGGTYATPIINYPDVAILGMGRIKDEPWVKDNAIVVRKILHLSFTFDHRVADGSEAGRFLNDVISYLEDPGLLFIESA